MRFLIKYFLVVLIAIIISIYLRYPVIVDPNVSLCNKNTMQVHEPTTVSDFIPGLCRKAYITHQNYLVSNIYDCGIDASKGVVVLLHGFPDNAKTWRKQVEPLVNEGFRVIIPSMRGYDYSTSIGGKHITELATDIICITEALNIKQFDIIGHDWGSVVAHTLGITYSEKVRAIISIAVPPQFVKFGGKILMQHPDQLINSWYMLFFQIPFIPEYLLSHSNYLISYLVSTWSPSYDWSNDKYNHLQEIIDTFKIPGVASAAVQYYRENQLSFLFDAIGNILSGGISYLDISHPVRGIIQVDTLLVTGRDDGCIKTEIYDFDTTNVISNDVYTKTIRLSGGHFVHYENAKEFNKHMINFLTRRPETQH